jgi:hypothetical protein
MKTSGKIYSEYRNTVDSIHQIQKELQKLPIGRLVCRKSGKYRKLFCVSDGQYRYLKKSDLQLSADLALRKYYELRLSSLESEKKLFEELMSLQEMNQKTISAVFSPDSKFHNLLKQRLEVQLSSSSDIMQQWVCAEYQKSASHPEHLIYKTASGDRVRSKSEVIIANTLFANGIPFRYEAALMMEDTTYYPDFTIMHPVTLEIYYLEHFGLIDNPEYMMRSFRKVESFISAGIIPTHNLICTYETSAHPLDSDYIQRLVHLYFL